MKLHTGKLQGESMLHFNIFICKKNIFGAAGSVEQFCLKFTAL